MNPEFYIERPVQLEAEDMRWLDKFGIPNNFFKDIEFYDFRNELDELINVGSCNLRSQVYALNHTEVIEAREKFFKIIGFSEDEISTLQKSSKALIPIGTFIQSQRILCNYGIDSSKIILANPAIIGYAPETIKEKLDGLTSLGIDVVKAVSANSEIIGYAPETIKEKLDGLTSLGLNALKIVNTNTVTINLTLENLNEKIRTLEDFGIEAIELVNNNPHVLNYSTKNIEDKCTYLNSLGLNLGKIVKLCPSVINLTQSIIIEKMENLRVLGLDPVRVVNSFPIALSLSSDSVALKFRNISDLGLDPLKIFKKQVSLLGYSSNTIREKLLFLQKIVKVLRWDGDVEELVNCCPSILATNKRKLLVLARVASSYLSKNERKMPYDNLKTYISLPLEKYIITLSDNTNEVNAHSLYSQARSVMMNQAERQATAKCVALDLGKVGVSYLRYLEK